MRAEPPSPPVVDPNTVMLLDQATTLMDLPPTCLRREARLGRLRVSRRAGRLWTTGRWLLEWLEGGEVRRHPRKVHASTPA